MARISMPQDTWPAPLVVTPDSVHATYWRAHGGREARRRLRRVGPIVGPVDVTVRVRHHGDLMPHASDVSVAVREFLSGMIAYRGIVAESGRTVTEINDVAFPSITYRRMWDSGMPRLIIDLRPQSLADQVSIYDLDFASAVQERTKRLARR